METEKRLELVQQVGEEIVTLEELQELLRTKKGIVAYDGFEPSGNIHIAQGIMRAININKMAKAGIRFKMLVADWHAWANNKIGGNLENIQVVGKYLIETWKACGLDMEKVDFVWASDIVKDDKYWKIVMKVAINNTIKRVVRCSQIMGRGESDVLSASQIFYPCMQAADIFYLRADICQLGMDQRKVNMLAREIGPKLGFWKPVVVSHHMLRGLGQPPTTESATDRAIEMKMSKSNPESAIFMTDTKEQIRRKLVKAYCPEKVVEENPVLEYCKYLVFEKYDSFTVERPEKYGGNLEFKDYAEMEKAYMQGLLHPMDLKNAVAEYLDRMIEPIRNHFEKDKKARELKERALSFAVTR